MSIIYEALKKIETNLQNEPKKPQLKEAKKRTSSGLKILAIYLLVILSGIVGTRFLLGLISAGQTRGENAVKGKNLTLKAVSSVEPVNKPQVTLPQAEAVVAPIQPQVKENKTIAELVLNGIFFSGNDGYALLNNQIVKEGDTVSGVLVQKINSETIELKTPDSSITLSLDHR